MARTDPTEQLASQALAGLHDIDWSAMTHAYGSAEEVPEILRDLISADPETREHCLDYYLGAVNHQGSVCDSTLATIPFCDPDPKVRLAAAQALKRLGPLAAPASEAMAIALDLSCPVDRYHDDGLPGWFTVWRCRGPTTGPIVQAMSVLQDARVVPALRWVLETMSTPLPDDLGFQIRACGLVAVDLAPLIHRRLRALPRRADADTSPGQLLAALAAMGPAAAPEVIAANLAEVGPAAAEFAPLLLEEQRQPRRHTALGDERAHEPLVWDEELLAAIDRALISTAAEPISRP
ncbi:MAG: hypothetical protein HKP61_10625 [Dactylosporangium sp.]|nr:hypothetical protein [Dactylosporangium sp.]NNJ61383.1 hypothetical protein [Dactylosporangium sp.]